ncbi:MAG: hypothetical protein ABIS06_17580 [Vicinamibacterales bacterium]
MNSNHAAVSVARMVSPSGWVEPGQRPEFEEITVILRGLLRRCAKMPVHASTFVIQQLRCSA